jgi:uncharacterized protein YcnI
MVVPTIKYKLLRRGMSFIRNCSRISAGAALVATSPAWGHVVLSQAQAPAGSYYTAYFRVGHGCAGSATTALRIEVPPDVVTVRPQPKPGWSLNIEHQPLASPIKGEGGRLITERVSAITWTGGPLPDDEWDEFGMSTKLPDHTGVLYFPAVQICVQGSERWADTPSGGAPAHLSHPAPTVTLGPPAAAADSMANMKM